MLKRFLRRRGFGIHSPAAFGFVRQVIRPGRVAYYGYAELKSQYGRRSHDGLNRSEAAMLLRLCARYGPFSLQVRLPQSLKLPSSLSLSCDGRPLMIMHGAATYETLPQSNDITVFWSGLGDKTARECYRRYRADMTGGIAFEGRTCAIVMPSESAQRRNYKI